MKIDINVNSYPLTPEQKFFVLCWHNMVHAYSLDSHRVRAMNSINVLRELSRIYSLDFANDDDKRTVALEAHEIINKDPALLNPIFARCKENFNSVYDPKTGVPKPDSRLLQYFCAEFQAILSQHYVPVILIRLNEILIASAPTASPVPSPDVCTEINKLTNSLLSHLLDKGTSLESLYQYYRHVLVPFLSVPNQRKYQFSRKFGLIEKLITREPENFTVLFLVHGVSDVTSFPESIGGIAFWHGSPLLPAKIAQRPAGKKFYGIGARTLCAEVEVEAQDQRSAGITAYSRLNDVMDLVRFEYERERISIEEEFISIAPPSQDLNALRHKAFRLPKVVPNPPAIVDASQLEGFVQSVNHLVSNGNFSPEGRDRIHSAFRLYRTGLDTNTFDNKLINWWTAIEYLVRDGETGGIGKSVEANIVPILCLGYISKHLMTYRSALIDLNVLILDPSDGAPIRLKELNVADLYLLFKRPDITPLLLQAVQIDPFLHFKLKDFLSKLSQHVAIHDMHAVHEKRLRWHMQRLWRTRCDIVHSAGQVVNAALLCANLEFYLKSTLTMLLQELRSVATISTPKEFFERQKHSYQQIQAGLKSGSDRLFVELLAK